MTTPFSTAPAAYKGALPSGNITWTDVRSRRLWLGLPGNMIELPSPSASGGLSAAKARGEQVHTLANGAAAVTYLPDAARTFTYSWPALTERDWQILNGFYMRAFGAGPWRLVNPEGWNRLTRRQSMCGAVSGLPEGWTAGGGSTVAYDTADGAAPITPCGVLKWSGLPNSPRSLVPGSDVNIPDAKTGIPYVPAEPFTFSAWVKVSAGTPSVLMRLAGNNADGTNVATISGPTVALTSSWQQLSVIAAPGDLGAAAFVVPTIRYVSGGTADAVLVANPAASYTSQAIDWGIGGGVPRVVWSSGAPRDLRATLRSGMQVTLSESGVG